MKIVDFLMSCNFSKETTIDAVVGLYAYMRNNDIPDDAAMAWVERIVLGVQTDKK